MDNSPRNRHLTGGGTAIDTSSEMVLFARNLAQIATVLGKAVDAAEYTREANELAALIENQMWNPARRVYFDLTLDGEHAPVRTIGAYWTLIAGVPSAERAKWLAEELENPKSFGRPNSVPTLAADEPLYDAGGGYWRGAVWAPTTTMVVRGLEAYGHDDLARRLALQHLNLVAEVYRNTGTIWENYSPEKPEPGRPALKNFVGWSGIGPILFLLEFGIGLKPDATRNELVWNLQTGSRLSARRGCGKFRFNGHVASLVAEPDSTDDRQIRISVDSDGAFGLKVARGREIRMFAVHKGSQTFTVPQ
jgi:glycogen debranching enzyme